MNKNSILALVLSLTFLVMIYFLGYHSPRESFMQFIVLYLGAFAMFLAISLNKQEWKIWQFFILAIAVRLLLLFAVPELSNDFYRFIWDGELITRGINPYAHTPNELISQPPIYSDVNMRILFHGMGELSQQNYSCYPVFNQVLFYVPAAITDNIAIQVILLKLIVILADIGAIFIGIRILKLLKKSVHLIWLYALNPFIILEFSGNIHFEGVMIFFVLLAIYYILLDKWLMAGVFFALAIQVKLLPLILIPFVFKKLKWQRSLGFTSICAVVVLSMSMLLLNESFYGNFMSSINLYFNSFEFNASLFYLAREYSFATVGYDDISHFGPLLSKFAAVGIGLLAVFKAHKNDSSIFTGMLFALVIYYAFATTVHPWYIALILVFCIFTKYKFGLVWSLLVMLSYFAYSNSDFEENLTFVFIEYTLVFGIMIYEIIRYTKKDNFGLQIKEFFKKS